MTDPHGTPIAWYTRLWLFAELFFGVTALLSVALYPADTATKFAWPIKPTVAAAVLGGFYIALSGVVALAAAARRWEPIRVLIPPAIAFTTLELIATVLHWQKFAHGSPGFAIWLASYVLPPPIFVIAYLLQQRRAAPRDRAQPLPRLVRGVLFVLGGALALEGLIAMVHPPYLADFPWQLTPLMTRAYSGWFVLVGGVMLAAAWENHRARVRIAGPFLALLLPAIAFQMWRYHEGVDFSHFRIVNGVVVLGVTCLIGLYLSAGSWRETLGR